MHAHDDKVFCSSIERVHVRAIDNGALIETIPIFGVCCFATWGEVVLCGGGCGIALLTVKVLFPIPLNPLALLNA